MLIEHTLRDNQRQNVQSREKRKTIIQTCKTHKTKQQKPFFRNLSENQQQKLWRLEITRKLQIRTSSEHRTITQNSPNQAETTQKRCKQPSKSCQQEPHPNLTHKNSTYSNKPQHTPNKPPTKTKKNNKPLEKYRKIKKPDKPLQRPKPPTNLTKVILPVDLLDFLLRQCRSPSHPSLATAMWRQVLRCPCTGRRQMLGFV